MVDQRSTASGPRRRSGERRGGALLCAAVVSTVVLLGLGMPSARAHDELVAASPSAGASVPTAPAGVELEFSGAIQPLGTEVLVTGPDGATVSGGAVEVSGATVVQPLTGDLPAGAYGVQWRATSSDGHPLSGAFEFTVEEAPSNGPVASDPSGTGSAVEPGPAVAAGAGAGEPTDSSPSVGWLAAGALVVAAGGLGARRLRNRR